jgi:hypothetical protein
MSNNTKIFSEAIAEAKAIRETAMTNAKLALEEAFAPRMQEMMSNKLEALAEEDEEMEEGFKKSNGEAPEDDSMDEISLEELIAELDSLEESDDVDDPYTDETGESTANDDEPYSKSLAEAEDDDTVGEITVDDLKDIIRDVFADLMGGESEEGEEEGPEEEEAGEEEAPEEGEDEINLEEILAELDSLNENEDLEEGELDEYGNSRMKEPSDSAAAGAAELERMIKALAAKMGTSFEAAYDKIGKLIHGGKGLGVRESEELEEAMSTISTLRSELNEVNLLNAKLLYVNKLFKSKNLTEAQKVKVINAFDRAETVKETKNIFETLKESLNAPVKSAIKESLSFASKAAGVADRKPIVENNDFVARMQKLAGII